MFHEEIVWEYRDALTNYPYEIVRAGKTGGTPYKIFQSCPSRIFVIGYVLKGKGYIKDGDNLLEVSAGYSFILSAGKPHSYYADENDPWEFIWINIKGSLITSLATLFGLPYLKVYKSEKSKFLIEQIHFYCRNSAEWLSVHSLSAPKIMELIEEATKDNFAPNEELSLAETVKNMLDGAILGRISLTEISEKLEYSDVHINRIFKAAYGETPHKYLILQKLHYSQGLLTDTSMSISEISSILGFSDEFHFSNSFYKEFGIRPMAYRKKNTLTNTDE